MASPSKSSSTSDGKAPVSTTISYTRPGLAAPVYLTTNMTDPPWEIREMSTSNKKTEDGDLIFSLHLDKVTPGVYEYKVRIGESEWVIDQNEGTVDDNGICNNVKHVHEAPPTIPNDAVAVSNPDPTQAESPLLPHERWDSPEQPPKAAQPTPQEALVETSTPTSSTLKRTATLPLETITEGDEATGSSQQSGAASLKQSRGASPQQEESDGEEDNELDNPLLLPHEEETMDSNGKVAGSTAALHKAHPVEAGIFDTEHAPVLGHEDIPPYSEEKPFLLPHECPSRTPSDVSIVSEEAPDVIDDGQQIFSYEAEMEPAVPDGYETFTLRETSRTPSPDQPSPDDEGGHRPLDFINIATDSSGSQYGDAERHDGTHDGRHGKDRSNGSVSHVRQTGQPPG